MLLELAGFAFLVGSGLWARRRKARYDYEKQVRTLYLKTGQVCNWEIPSQFGIDYVPLVIEAKYGGLDITQKLQEYADEGVVSFHIDPFFLLVDTDIDPTRFQECMLDLTYQAQQIGSTPNVAFEHV